MFTVDVKQQCNNKSHLVDYAKTSFPIRIFIPLLMLEPSKPSLDISDLDVNIICFCTQNVACDNNNCSKLFMLLGRQMSQKAQ